MLGSTALGPLVSPVPVVGKGVGEQVMGFRTRPNHRSLSPSRSPVTTGAAELINTPSSSTVLARRCWGGCSALVFPGTQQLQPCAKTHVMKGDSSELQVRLLGELLCNGE